MMDTSPHQPIGQQLRQYRLAAGLSQEALSEASGVSVRTISDLERGQRMGAHLETVRMLAVALTLTEDERHRLLIAAHARAHSGDGATVAKTPIRIGSAKWNDSLPESVAPLVGRDEEIDRLVALLIAKPGLIVTLTGPGGVGKTSLAIAGARNAASTFADGVAFVDLSAISQATSVPDAIAQVLGMALSTAPIADRLPAMLATRELLLVLDNFEHVIDAAPFVARLNADCPRLTVLVTSRVRLHVSHEHEFAVPPLRVASPGDPLERIRESSAIRLFAERAATADRAFELSERNASDVAEICRRVDGLPLAIELAASRLRVLPVEILLERLEHRLPLLTGGHRDLPQRQRSMRETIAWSYDLLKPAEQQFLRWMSVFVGGLSLESVEALGDELRLDAYESLETVSTLIDNALVQRAISRGGQPRFHLFETIREFGVEQLGHAGELEEARRFHATHFLAFAQRDAPRPDEPIRDLWIATIFAERHNLAPAFDFLCQPDTAELCLQFATAMGPYWNFNAPLSEGCPRVNRAIELAPPEPSVLKSHVLFWTSLLLGTTNDVPEGLSAAHACIAVAEEVGTPRDKAAAIQVLAWIHEYNQHWDIAQTLLKQALERWIELGNEYMQAVCLMLQGGIEYARGNLDLANVEEARAGEIFQQVGVAGWAASAVWYQGMFAVATGQLDIAAQKYDQSIRLWLESDNSSLWFKPLVGQADVAAAIGDHARSARFIGAVDELLDTAGMDLMPFDEPAYDRAEVASRRALEDTAFAEHRRAGSLLTQDDWLADSSAIVEAAHRLMSAPDPSHSVAR